MRVVSGKYKGKKLEGFNIEGTRPTMDRIKESMFAMIQNCLKDATILDLFAGSGSLGIEALSNGSKECYFVDINNIAINTIKRNTEGIEGVTIIKNDWDEALLYFKLHNITFDIVLLDPPYKYEAIEVVIDRIVKHDLLKDNGIIVCESDTELRSSLRLVKIKNYGNKMISIFKR